MSNRRIRVPQKPTSSSAFEGEGVWVLRSRADRGTVSGWHSHGDHTVYGYVVSGAARFESGPGGRDGVTIGAGDIFAVPPNAVHRESNPSPTEDLEIFLFLKGREATVFNVEGPDPPWARRGLDERPRVYDN